MPFDRERALADPLAGQDLAHALAAQNEDLLFVKVAKRLGLAAWWYLAHERANVARAADKIEVCGGAAEPAPVAQRYGGQILDGVATDQREALGLGPRLEWRLSPRWLLRGRLSHVFLRILMPALGRRAESILLPYFLLTYCDDS